MPDTAPHPDYFALAASIVATQQAARNAARLPGVRWSGMDPELPTVETPENVALRLQRRDEAREVFLATPRGRYLKAVNSLGALGWDEADPLLSIYSRSLADEGAPLNFEAIGRAVRILNGIPHSHARDAIGALADLLAPALAKAA